jgi:MOB kinase activator 1
MNLSMDLDVLECQGWRSPVDVWSGPDCPRSESELPRSQETGQGPLQRIEDALRIQQQTHSDANPNVPSYAPPYSSPVSSKTNSPIRNSPKYCYFPDHGVGTLMSKVDTREIAVSGYGQDVPDTGSTADPGTRAQKQTPHNRGYFVGPSLLSSVFSNPRTTRAPFKPQKAGRGTSSWQLKQYAEATLGSGSLRKAVKLPEGEDKDEWLAVNGGT